MNGIARVSIDRVGDRVLARVVGEIDLSNAEQLIGQLLEEPGASAGGLVIDLSQTTYIDSAGIRALFELAERLTALGGRIRTVLPEHSPLRRVMALAEAERALSPDQTVEDALAALDEDSA